MTSVYAQRRARLAAQLGAGGIAIIPTAPERQRNRDTGYLYRHDSYFYYLTGFAEPNACLVLAADGTSVLFCQPKDLEREIWDGIRLGPEAAVATLGVTQAFSSAEIDTRLPRQLENRGRLWYPFATHEGLAVRVEGWLGQLRARVRLGSLFTAAQGDPSTMMVVQGVV
jgi:Xaa-Pro aminopeptidase